MTERQEVVKQTVRLFGGEVPVSIDLALCDGVERPVLVEAGGQ